VRDQITGDAAVLLASSSAGAEAGPPQLAHSKLTPPRPAAACITRTALLERLDRAARRKLVLLAAPTGSGKSTLLTQWHRQTRASRAIAWLSLDEQDDEPVRFFCYLQGAVRSVISGFSTCIGARRDADPGALVDALATTFSEQLSRVDRELAIVIDDCHWLAPPLSRGLDFLLRRSPANVHWVLAGRCLPEVSLTALRLNDDLTLIGSDELRFDRQLIVQLSRRLSHRPLSLHDAESILDRTEGWVAGVKLALLAREEPTASNAPREPFGGSHCEVASYFGGSVLQEQTAETRAFLLASSIVDRMTGELCDALLDIHHSQQILERLERAQLFIQPLDGHRHWFRYHTLFLDFLRSRLKRDEPGQVAMLHERASRWYAEHQFFDEALTHAFAAKNLAWRNELLARCSSSWLQDGEVAAVLRWSERLAPSEIAASFPIARPYVAALILCRRFNEAAEGLRALRRSHEADTLIVGQLAVLEAMYSMLADSDDAHAIDMDRLQSTGVDVFLNGTLLTLEAYALLRRNQFDVSRRAALRAREVLHQSVYGRGYADAVAALADRAQGNLKSAADRCEATFAEVRSGRRSPAWVNAATSVAYTRYEENRLPEAESLCIEILPLLSVASTIENFTTAYTTLARIKSASGQIEEAAQLLEYLHSVLEGGTHRRFLAQVWAEKLVLRLRDGKTECAARLAREAQLERRFLQGEFDRLRVYDEAWERAGAAYAQLLLHTERYTEAHAVLTCLRASANEAGYVYRQVRLEAALACCLGEMGEHAESFAVLNGALALTRGYGFTRGVFDEVPLLTRLIRRALDHHVLRHTLPFHYLRKFDNLFAARPRARPTPRHTPPAALPLEPLTDREIEILRLLARGLSNTEISEHSQIALSTAKWHLKNVFAKLDVSTRTGALARARELRLVD